MTIFEMFDLQSLILASLTFTVAGVIGFWCKDVPMKLFNFLKRQFTTTVYLTTHHHIFFTLIDWIAKEYKGKNFRDFKLTNGRWGNDDDSSFSIGYGWHIIRYRHHLFWVTLESKESHGIREDKEVITIRKFGRSRKAFDLFFRDIERPRVDGKVEIYQLIRDYWAPRGEMPHRPMQSVFMEEDKRQVLLTTLNDFVASEDWYVKHGIPYQLGILLYGKPGTGKSSLIKAIASYLGYDIYYLSSSQLYKLDNGLDTLPPKNALMVIEDIDCEPATHRRVETNSEPEEPQVRDKIKVVENLLTMTNLSDILNLLDGICSIHGRILIMTSNHAEKLDPALIRPGRVDLRLEIGYVNTEILEQFLISFYDHGLDGKYFEIRPDVSCAELQNMAMQKLTREEILSNLEVKK